MLEIWYYMAERQTAQTRSPDHKIIVRVYYEDTDFSGIVYHANYLKFFERGRTDALRACKITHTDLLAREEPLVFAVRRMDTQWHVPAKIDDLLEVRTWFVLTKGARMILRQEIHRADENNEKDKAVLIASADVEAACLSLEGRPKRLPIEVVEKLGITST